MTSGALPPDRVPTLTEVVAWPQPPAAAAAQLPLPAVEARPAEADLLSAHSPPLRVAEAQMIEGVLLEVQRQVELMLDYRLREALTPLLARAADGIVREARTELASTLRDVVARAVAQELARHRKA
ncbi:MAG TPA: hypothetical protein VFA35_06840 [Burkholderiaceae bacterium]|nr:hypothetical protein [Burkholderiaceae bacterium]